VPHTTEEVLFYFVRRKSVLTWKELQSAAWTQASVAFFWLVETPQKIFDVITSCLSLCSPKLN